MKYNRRKQVCELKYPAEVKQQADQFALYPNAVKSFFYTALPHSQSKTKGGIRMSTGAILEQKQQIVTEIADKMKAAESFVIVNYKGINVAQVTALRVKAREIGVEYKIYKNTFLRFAAKECGYGELVGCLEGTTAVVFSDKDAVAPAKLIADFVKENKLQTLDFVGGVIDKSVTDVESIQKISQLPSKEVLLAKMLGSLNAPIANFAYVINAIKDQKSA